MYHVLLRELIKSLKSHRVLTVTTNTMHIIYWALQYLQNILLMHILQLPLQFATQISTLIADLQAISPSQLGQKLNIH